MYLSALTDDELLRLTGTQELTPLEKELVKRFEAFREEAGDKDAEIDKLKVDLADAQDEIEALKGEM